MHLTRYCFKANFVIGNQHIYHDFLSELRNYSYLAVSHPRRWGGIQVRINYIAY
jgi:hypothetical protein